METTLLISSRNHCLTSIASYGYYLIFNKELAEFEEKRKARTRYRTNEEFIKS